jgi:hypothetical protein
MSFFTKVLDFVGGGVGETIVNTVKEYFPPSLSEGERLKLEEAIRKSARQHEETLLKLAQEEQALFDQRMREMEGTAKDLEKFGVIGKIVVFMRGLQRPIWGFFVLYLDYQVFIQNKWPTVSMSQTAQANGLDFQSAFWIINFLVLGFLFGERAMRNVLPLIQQKMGNQSGSTTQAKG